MKKIIKKIILPSVLVMSILALLTGCECITDTNQTFALHTGSVTGEPCLLTDCSAERDKYKWYIIEAPGTAVMLNGSNKNICRNQYWQPENTKKTQCGCAKPVCYDACF